MLLNIIKRSEAIKGDAKQLNMSNYPSLVNYKWERKFLRKETFNDCIQYFSLLNIYSI